MRGGNGRKHGTGNGRRKAEDDRRRQDFVCALVAMLASRRRQLGGLYHDLLRTTCEAIAGACGYTRERVEALAAAVEDDGYRRAFHDWTMCETRLAAQILGALDPGNRFRVAIIRLMMHAFNVKETDITDINAPTPVPPTSDLKTQARA